MQELVEWRLNALTINFTVHLLPSLRTTFSASNKTILSRIVRPPPKSSSMMCQLSVLCCTSFSTGHFLGRRCKEIWLNSSIAKENSISLLNSNLRSYCHEYTKCSGHNNQQTTNCLICNVLIDKIGLDNLNYVKAWRERYGWLLQQITTILEIKIKRAYDLQHL